MKTFFSIIALCTTIHCFSQTDRKLSAFISVNVSATQYDRTLSNNTTGFGAGLQLYMRTKTWVRPALDVNSGIFGGTKELYVTADGKPIFAKSDITTVFAGAYFQPTNRLFATFTAGPGFFNNSAYLGIKPGVGYYILKGRQLAFSLSLTNIFQHDDISSQSFGYLNFSLAAKLF